MATDVLKEQHNNLQEENAQYKKLIRQLKDHLVSLEREVSAAKSRIQEKLAVPGGILKQRGKHRRHRKRIHILENKVNKDTIKFNELLCSNTDYRKDIAHLLLQKGVLCSIEEKFNRQLAAQQNIMEKLGERFDHALNQRSEAETRKLEMRESIEVETAHFIRRQMLLKTVINHDAKLQTFMERKLQEISLLEDDEDSKRRKKQQQHQDGVKKLEMYIQGHSMLVEATGETDLRQIGHMFIENEQKNFAHISYINELHSKRNMLKISMNKMKRESLFLEQDNKGHDEQSESQLKDLESEVEKYSCLADSLEQQCAVVHRTLDELKTAINSLLDETLQEAVTVTFDNIAHFNSIIEKIIDDMMIQANNVEDEQMELPLQSLLLANSELLPEREAVAETDRSRSASRSHKSAGSIKSQ